MNLVAEYRLRNNPSESRQIEGWVKSFAETVGLSPTARNAFDLALVEWITNVISYAYEDQREHWITLRFLAAPGQARVEVEDNGRAFNPLDVPPADTAAPLEQRAVGGLGIHMIQQLMDAVEYRRQDARNILTLIRRTA